MTDDEKVKVYNDALEKAAVACLGVPVKKEAYLEEIRDIDNELIGTILRGPSISLPRAETYAAAIRALKYKKPNVLTKGKTRGEEW